MKHFFKGNISHFRIKACTRVDEENLIMAYREVGHIIYYQSYKKQNTMFRNGANPGIHFEPERIK